MIYEQGDIVEVDFSPTIGHEPAKRRPALVVSNLDFNISNSMTIVCPITSREKDFFLHEQLPDNCGAFGCVVMEQVRAIDLDARPTKLLGRLEGERLDDILACIASFFSPTLDRTR